MRSTSPAGSSVMNEGIEYDAHVNRGKDDYQNGIAGNVQDSNLQFDDILKYIGEFGRWQKIIYLLSCACVFIPSGFQTNALYFITGTPEFHCATPNVTCHENKCCDNCTNYVFDGPFTSTANEWNLICDRSYINANIEAGYSAGMLIGSLIFGFISDSFGRRFCILLCSLLATLFSLSTYFVHSVIVFTCLRAAAGACFTGMFVCHYVYLTELVGPSYRNLACQFSGFFWIVGELGVALLAYFIRDWRTLLLVISFFPTLCFLLWPILPESPRWLVVQGRLEEASSILMKYAKTSSVSLDPDSLSSALAECHQGEADSQRKKVTHSPLDLFRTSRMLKRTLILWFNWIVVSMVFFGFVYYVSDLPGNPYLNVTYMYVADIPSVFLCWIALQKFGRRIPYCLVMIIGGLACLLVLVVPRGHKQVTTVLAFVGRNLINIGFSVIYLYTSELYPTSIRNLAVGACSMTGRIGAIGAPYIVMLSQLPGVSVTLPMIIFGALGITAGLMILWLPETLNSNMPQTVEEMNQAKEYYGLVWMGRRVLNPISSIRCNATDKKPLLEVPAPFYGTTNDTNSTGRTEDEPRISK